MASKESHLDMSLEDIIKQGKEGARRKRNRKEAASAEIPDEDLQAEKRSRREVPLLPPSEVDRDEIHERSARESFERSIEDIKSFSGGRLGAVEVNVQPLSKRAMAVTRRKLDVIAKRDRAIEDSGTGSAGPSGAASTTTTPATTTTTPATPVTTITATTTTTTTTVTTTTVTTTTVTTTTTTTTAAAADKG
ncbi:hypothetical protein SCARD494_04306 [Seiridium cardinale]